MGTGRDVQGRILSLAFCYRVYGDKRYLDRAKAELLQLCELTNWGTGHFLDIGEASLAAAIGFDWLYKDLTPDEREKIVYSIVNKAILPALEVKEGANNTSWLNGNFNWNPVCNGGTMIAALAIYEHEPKIARQMVDRAFKYLPFAGAAYSPDGSDAEGPSYWSYGTSFYVLSIDALRSVFGTACGLDKMPGFLKTADYNNQMVGPSGNDYNYSDYHNENHNEPVMLWFGRELNRYDLIQDELTDLSRLYEKMGTGKNEKPGKNVVANRQVPLEIFWWNPDRSITIQDEWKTCSIPVEAVFQWLTRAKTTILQDGILLEQDGKSLMLKVEAPGSITKPEILIEDVSKQNAIQDSNNPGVSRIRIKLKSQPNSESKLIIRAMPQNLNR